MHWINLLIDFQVPQAVYAGSTIRRACAFNSTPCPGADFDGLGIESVVPVADPVSRTFLLRAAIRETGTRLAPGMSASALMRLDSGGRAWWCRAMRSSVIPTGASRCGSPKVDDEFPRARAARQPGSGFDGRVAITSGLEAGELVVVRGNESLYESQLVDPARNRAVNPCSRRWSGTAS